MMDTLSNLGTYALVALGIGLVIFVHECGHYLAARWCRVRVDVFSLGFGPRILGWRRGPTLYQLALLPLGGYVRMAGEEGLQEGRPPRDDELPGKSVGQRFFIYSGGVLANLLFAFVVFPILLLVGVPFPEPVLGPPAPGSPAWRAGLEPGTRVEAVNGQSIYSFNHIVTEVALGSKHATELVVREPGAGRGRAVVLEPEYAAAPGLYTIGVGPELSEISVREGSAAARAGLRSGDRLAEVLDVPAGLRTDEAQGWAVRDGAPLHAVFERPGETGDAPRRLEVTLVPETEADPDLRRLGTLCASNRIAAVRGTVNELALDLRAEDRLAAIDGRPVRDPWDALAALLASEEATRWTLLRDGARRELVVPALDRAARIELWRDVALAPDTASTVVLVQPGSPIAHAGVRTGDRVVAIDGQPLASYVDLQEAVGERRDEGSLRLAVERDADPAAPGAGTERFEVDVAPAPLALPDYGFGFRPTEYVYRATDPLEAVRVGWVGSLKFVQDIWLMLKGIAAGRVSGSNAGGIITIAVVSKSAAASGLASLFFFLCMLSVNLAFLNVLPIPVLDGGHLLFLLVEKVKGSPVSERVLGYSQMVGIVLILSLMVYVTFNDVVRWIGGAFG